MTTLFQGGTVLQGCEFVARDILVDGSVIVEVSERIPMSSGYEKIDVTGALVFPGFIDVHTHGDWAIVDRQYSRLRIAQGITTEVVGNCGVSAFPAGGSRLEAVQALATLAGQNRAGVCSGFPEYREELLQMGLQTNVGCLVGHSTLRLACQDSGRRMKAMLYEQLANGALGLSTGLDYPPGSLSTTTELLDLCRVLRERDSVYVTHFRSHDWFAGIEEILAIRNQAGVVVHVSHLKPWKSRIQETLALLDQEGITFDTYPFLRSQAPITTLLPAVLQESDLRSLMTALDRPEVRRRIACNSCLVPDLIGWEDITVCTHPDSGLVAKTIAEVAEERQAEPWDAVCDLMIESRGACTVTKKWREYDFDQLLAVVQSEQCVLASDSVPVGADYAAGHPRLYRTYPEFFERFIQDGHTTLEEAIVKCTSKPADIFGIKLRGQLRAGWYADLVVAQRDSLLGFRDVCSPPAFNPMVSHVMVNGVFVVRDEEAVGTCPGVVIL